MYSLFMNKKTRLTPVDFLETFREMQFQVQRDVYEFFNEFLNNLEDSLKAHEKPLEQLDENIKGEFINEIRFVQCGHIVTMHKEDFIVLSLEVKDMGDIRRSLEYFAHWELLQSLPQVCPKCGERSGREKRTRIGKLPKELIIHLKRFQFEKGQFIKLDEGFGFAEKLTLEEEGGESKKSDFNLRGVVCHSGSVEFGHYISLVKKDFDLGQEEKGSGSGVQEDIKNFNFQRDFKHKKTHAKSNWIMYNDDKVTQYDQSQLPKDCFGQFSNENDFAKCKFENKWSQEQTTETEEMSQDKVDLLKDLGVFDAKKEEKKKENDKIQEQIKQSMQFSKKPNQMNAYLLFYRRKDKTQEKGIREIIENIKSSEFGKRVQLDLDRELIIEWQHSIFGGRPGLEFVSNTVRNSFKHCQQQANQSNFQYLVRSMAFAGGYFFKFLCKTRATSQNREILGEAGNLLLNFLSPEKFEELKQKQKHLSDESFDEELKNNFLIESSVKMLSIMVDSDDTFSVDNGLWIELVSSRSDLYGCDGDFINKASSAEKPFSALSKLDWMVEVLIQSLSNLVSFYCLLCWDKKKVIFDFLKICLRMLNLYQVNASSVLPLITEALDSKEICHTLSRNGFQNILYQCVPQIFNEMSSSELRGWGCLRRLYRNLDSERFSDCRTLQEFLNVIYKPDSQDSESRFNF